MVDDAEAVVNVEGQITAPAHTLYEIVRKLPEGAEVSLLYSGDDPRLVVSAGRSRFNLPVLPAGDFPVMSTDTSGTRFTLAKEDLARLIDKTRFAVSTEETRYYLNGLYLHAVSENGAPLLRAVATDGHRLALAETPAPEGAAGGPGVIVPRKTVDQVRRLLDDAGGPTPCLRGLRGLLPLLGVGGLAVQITGIARVDLDLLAHLRRPAGDLWPHAGEGRKRHAGEA